MAKATVVFADGSKQMAHNLNDLDLRWYERKVAQAEEVGALYEQGIAIPNFSASSSIDEVLVIRAQFVAMKGALTEQLKVIGERQYGRVEERYRRRPIGYAIQLVDVQLSQIAAHIKQHNIAASESEHKEYARQLRAENEALKERIKELEATLSAYREVVTLQLAETNIAQERG